MTELQLKDIDSDQLHQLEEIAAEQGQPLDVFVAAVLTDILRHHRAEREKGLGTRIAKRFEGIGLNDQEIEELRGHAVQPPEFD
ncbi:hypothetical protein N9N28_17630 [Rubripirellula amarantea]|nr:hypothetical protein [Rubripirellula amarantea]